MSLTTAFSSIFLFLLLLVSLGRLLEIRRSKGNQRILLQNGAREYFPEHYRWMVLLHATWFISCATEAWWRRSVPPLWLTAVGGIVFLIGLSLRLTAMRTLGERWTTRIFVLPSQPLVSKGIYRYIRHPNYLGVLLEIAGLPLIVGAWRTALLFSLLNALLLYHRIRLEELAFTEAKSVLGTEIAVPRFIPNMGFRHGSKSGNTPKIESDIDRALRP
ncbi:MAG: isoprenylcysteine carboxyl methyltransferase [Deltaproteobacteria bacterium]|nr:isoprenylcysteine carboxyl methyltransferase [Deltaproteobacteria bacterium]